MKRKPPEGSADSEINMTPMLDVVFIMLIFFIVTATFVKEPGVEVEPPDAVTAEGIKPTILLAIDAEDNVWIDNSEVPIDSVKPQIERLHKENPKGGVEVQVDKNATNGALLTVLEQINTIGVPSVHVKTEDN